MPSWLFHNNGDGTFTRCQQGSGIAKHLAKAWGVVATDVNNDGRMDLFVSQRHDGELSVHQSRQWQDSKRSAPLAGV